MIIYAEGLLQNDGVGGKKIMRPLTLTIRSTMTHGSDREAVAPGDMPADPGQTVDPLTGLFPDRRHTRRRARGRVTAATTAGALAVILAVMIGMADNPAGVELPRIDSAAVGLTAAGDILPLPPFGALYHAQQDLLEVSDNYSALIGAGDQSGFHVDDVTASSGYENIANEMLPALSQGEGLVGFLVGPLLGPLNSFFFGPIVNEEWEHVAEQALNASNALDTAVTTGSGVQAAEFTAELSNLQVAGVLLVDLPLMAFGGLAP